MSPQMAMDPTSELQRRIARDPDAMQPRLDLADLYRQNGDGVRAQFIEDQCRLSEMPPIGRENGILSAELRRTEALHKRQQHWRPAGPQAGAVTDFGFRRGCVELIHLDGGDTLPKLAELAEWNPLRAVRFLTAPSASALDNLANVPFLTAVDFSRTAIDDALLAELTRQPYATNIRWLSLNFCRRITRNGLATLAQSMSGLQFADFAGLPFSVVEDEDGELPPSGEELEAAARRPLPWLHRERWIEGIIPPTALQMLDLERHEQAMYA